MCRVGRLDTLGPFLSEMKKMKMVHWLRSSENVPDSLLSLSAPQSGPPGPQWRSCSVEPLRFPEGSKEGLLAAAPVTKSQKPLE